MEDFSAWIGRSERTNDLISSAQLAGLAALLDHEAPPWPVGEAPPLGHWLHFLPQARQSAIDVDGHPKRIGFMPPVPLPRRMWAGGRIDFRAPLKIGAIVERLSTIADIQHKRGASGDLLFVKLRHDITADGVPMLFEEQDIVYRDGSSPRLATKAESSQPAEAVVPDIVRTLVPDSVQLFRFSALTYNGHRIHYDRDYARDVEGYGGLVVHGPFLATLLMDLFLRSAPDRRPTRFAFRAQSPLIDTAPFELCLAWINGGAKLWTRDRDGLATMTANVTAT